MPRRPRDTSPGLQHVWVNATGNWDYFLDDVDRLAWIRLLVVLLQERGWGCVAFTQVDTHVHSIFSIPDDSLPAGMRDLNREYGRAFNARHARVGAFVRKRYQSRKIQDGDDLLGTYPYVVLNPVKAGLCPRAEDWRWSSYATSIRISNDFPFVDASVVEAELDGGSLAELVNTAHRRWSETVESGTRYRAWLEETYRARS